ncbi:MAG: DUF1015 domain-containing protein [Clostridia bacterium]|nr:DUF1015 domain-containing protein [Clostridia bacterium]
MANVYPFRAWRFSAEAGDMTELVCPPYDIISDEQRRAYLAQNEHNIIRLELPREGEDPYAEAGKTVKAWCEDGTLARDEEAAFYVYDIEFEVDNERKNVGGILAAVEISPFSEGVVLPHEWTLSKAKTDRLNLMKATNFNFSDIYSLYQADTKAILDRVMETAPLNDLVDGEGLRHRLWAITDKDTIAEVQAAFDGVKLYIADGHHRYETALNYKNWRLEQGLPVGGAARVMMMLVEMSHPGLVVFPTHRLLRDLPDFDVNKLLTACEADFAVERDLTLDDAQAKLAEAYDAGKKAFVVYAGGETSALLTLTNDTLMDSLLPEESAVSRQLDVNVLHSGVLERVLGIDKENMAQQINLTYTRILGEAIDGVQNGTYQCAILLNPTRVSEIQGVAAAGEKMPQKSTYFYPKLITGLTMNELD